MNADKKVALARDIGSTLVGLGILAYMAVTRWVEPWLVAACLSLLGLPAVTNGVGLARRTSTDGPGSSSQSASSSAARPSSSESD